jgi:hypothetical protein
VLTLAGTADPNGAVSVHDGSTLLGAAKRGSSGVASIASSSVDGETGAPSHTFNSAILNANGSATLSGIALENGVAEAGDLVKVYDGTTYLGSTTVGNNGSWSFTTPALSNSVHTFTSTVTDLAGNIGQSSSSASFNTNTFPTPVRMTGDSFVFNDAPFAKGAATQAQAADVLHSSGQNPETTGQATEIVSGMGHIPLPNDVGSMPTSSEATTHVMDTSQHHWLLM